ncbi:MAG: hypothetical protein Q8M09_16045, partial [Pseudomonadota bacterium]|nr:hypothetical protein [Pseudomonadota bacterium]MDP2351056.1 hypothetical protein [Pseudomonadota bacterium]
MTLPAFCSGTLTARILAFAAGLFLVIPTASQIHAFLAQKELAEEIERIIVKVQGRAQEAVGTIQSAERSTRKADVLRHLDQLARLIPVAYDVPPALCEQYAYHANRLKLAG